MNPIVVWTSRAEQRLELQLRRAIAPGHPPPAVVGRIAELNRYLAAAFRSTGTLVVLDVYSGYRPRSSEFVLRCDLRDPIGRCQGTVIVKLTTADVDESLRAERDAWERTRSPGFTGDAVFMTQVAHSDPDEPHRLVAVSYRDAQPYIGTDQQLPLADAFLSAIRFDTPSVQSVREVIAEVFDHLHRGFHARSRVAEPMTAALELNPDSSGVRRSLLRQLRGWRSDPGLQVRALVESSLPDLLRGYIDPVAFFEAMERMYRDGGDLARRYGLRPHRGPAHGDLHGLNVLLGRTDERVHSAAVFDYEHMYPDNLIALDYAKLETELKIRAYRHLFPYSEPANGLPPRAFLDRVIGLEQQLWQEQSPESLSTAEGRFLSVVRAIRMAFLNQDRSDPTSALREYAFLLAAYAVGTIRFANHTLDLRAAALISAGVAAHQFVTLSDERTLPPTEDDHV